jgi:hypothetical protein
VEVQDIESVISFDEEEKAEFKEFLAKKTLVFFTTERIAEIE